MTNVSENKKRFIDLVKTNVHRDGVDGLLLWLENSDFYIAPASTHFHESYEGGLCEHSLNVYDHLSYLNKIYNANIPEETVTICALFHDLCKVGCYVVGEKNVKGPDGTWHKEPFYKWDEANKFGGHGSKSVFVVQSYIKLHFDEATAINCHMGIENGNCNAILDAYRDNALAFLLHVADMASTIPAMNDYIGLRTGDAE